MLCAIYFHFTQYLIIRGYKEKRARRKKEIRGLEGEREWKRERERREERANIKGAILFARPASRHLGLSPRHCRLTIMYIYVNGPNIFGISKEEACSRHPSPWRWNHWLISRFEDAIYRPAGENSTLMNIYRARRMQNNFFIFLRPGPSSLSSLPPPSLFSDTLAPLLIDVCGYERRGHVLPRAKIGTSSWLINKNLITRRRLFSDYFLTVYIARYTCLLFID